MVIAFIVVENNLEEIKTFFNTLWDTSFTDEEFLELKTINIDHKKITTFPNLSILENLQTLTLTNIHFQDKYISIQHPTIKTVRVSQSNLENLELNTPNLTRLNISDNQLSEVPKIPNKVTHLDLSGNLLKTIDEFQKKLIEINIGFNLHLESICPFPSRIRRLHCSQLPKIKMLPKLPKDIQEVYAFNNDLTLKSNDTEEQALYQKLTIDYTIIEESLLSKI